MTEGNNNSRQKEVKYMSNLDLMRGIADIAGIDSYDPSTESDSTKYARFNREERRAIYKEISGESGEDLLRKELPSAIMRELDSELNSSFGDEFAREDLKKIYFALMKDKEC